MSFEMELAKRLQACQSQFALLANINQNQQLDTLRSRGRHLYPMQFRPERDFSLELVSSASNQNPHSNRHSFNQGQADTPTARRMRELAIYNYIATNTNFLSDDPETREKQGRLLKHYIELYAHNPFTYPTDNQNETHCVIHMAGKIVLEAEENQRKEAQNRQNSAAPANAPSDAPPAKLALLKIK